MLVQFTVRNFRSIRDEQTLSLVKGKGSELSGQNSFDPQAPATGELLRSAVIYGPNAAGKTSLIDALKTMKDLVTTSSTKLQHGDELPVVPFKLDRNTEGQPSEFEVIFVADGTRYQYGFSASEDRVFEEWLLAYPNGRPQRWFGRSWDVDDKKYCWDMGSALSGQKQLWQESTRQNALFLSTAVQLNSIQLKPVYDWFRQKLRLANVVGWTPEFTASQCEDLDSRKRILNFIKAADIDIQDIKIESEKFAAQHLPAEMPEEIRERILDNLKDHKVYDIKTIHHGLHGQLVEFDFDDESDGTQKLFAFAGPWLDVLDKGYVLLVDELHDNLHPKIVQFLVDLFHQPEINKYGAQLVFTTHDTSILNQDVFRRDQVWFCEKDAMKSTRLYPLTDFSPRKGREDLEAGYLSGRYGALPYLRNFLKVSAASGDR